MLEELLVFYTPLALGLIYGRMRQPSDEALNYMSRLILYILLPFLLFRSTYLKAARGIGLNALGLPVLGAVTVIAAALVAHVVFGGKTEYTMTCMYANAGYLPLSLALPLWGDPGVADVGFYILGNNTTANVLIPIIASGELKNGLRRVVKFPPLYGILAGLLTGFLGSRIPPVVLDIAGYIGNAAPPMALIVLGAEFAGMLVFDLEGVKVYMARTAVALFLYYVFASFGVLSGFLDLRVGLLESLMPSAVTNVILAHEFSLDSKRVSTIVVTSTIIASFISIPLFLAFP